MHQFVFACVAVCLAYGADAIGLGATQAGEPMAVNVDYDVPVYGAMDAAARAQRGLDLEAKLRAKSSLRSIASMDVSSSVPFSALAMRAAEEDMERRDAVVTVHVPSASGAGITALAEVKADASLLEHLAQAQDVQEQKFLDEVEKVTGHLRRRDRA